MAKKKKIVCIGHSIVYGYPHPKKDCFVSLLRDALPEYEVINKGENGDTAPGIMRRFSKDVIEKHPYAALLMVGTNDFVLENKTVEECMNTVKAVSESALSENIRIILLTPVLCDAEKAVRAWAPADYEYANRQISELSEMMKEYAPSISEKYNRRIRKFNAEDETSLPACLTIDLQTAYTECNDFVDGIHPTVKGHRFIADTLLENLEKSGLR